MYRDAWERIVCATTKGIYESNYLKANQMKNLQLIILNHEV